MENVVVMKDLIVGDLLMLVIVVFIVAIALLAVALPMPKKNVLTAMSTGMTPVEIGRIKLKTADSIIATPVEMYMNTV
jgi:hypothetical protein